MSKHVDEIVVIFFGGVHRDELPQTSIETLHRLSVVHVAVGMEASLSCLQITERIRLWDLSNTSYNEGPK